MKRKPSLQRQSLRAWKVAAIIGLGCLVCSTARANDFFEAMKTGDIAQIRVSIDAGVDVNVKNEYSVTPLLMAVAGGHTEIVQLLVVAKADVNAAHINGVTPLWMAGAGGHTEIVKLLLAAKADVNAAHTDGATPLWKAAQKGHTEIVELLLAAKADVNAASIDGRTPLFMAAQEGHTEIVELLLAAKADVNAASTDGRTPLFMAAQEGHTELVKILLAAKADINAADNTDGVTPLWMAAAQEGHAELVKLLLAAKADINAASTDGRTPLFMAVQEGHTELVKLLLAARSVLADDSDDPAVIIRQTVDQILAVLANKDHSVDQRVRQIEEIAYDRFDFATISRLALARRWKGFSPEQREEFVEQYKIQLSRRYGTRITRYEQEKVEILGSRVEPGGDVTVRTRIEGGSADGIEVNYRLRKKDGPWLVIDVIIEGVSLVSSDRSQFAEILGRGGPSELLKQMREKNLRLLPENSSREAGSSGPGQTSE